MNVVSLCDGISCGRLALEKAGITVDKYYSSEIDATAIEISKKNYPDIIRLGDVTKITSEVLDTLPIIDLIIFGSPCQSVSVLGNQTGFDGKSGLFFECTRILKHLQAKNPNLKFLVENVCMKKEWKDVMSLELGVEPICINSSLMSAQLRKRLYWTNIKNDGQPRDKQIRFQDILESGYALTEKAYCLTVKGGVGLTVSGFRKALTKKGTNLILKDKPVLLNYEKNLFEQNLGDSFRIGKNNVRLIHKSIVPIDVGIYENKREILFVYENDDSIKALVRQISVTEVERLQTVTEGYTQNVSRTNSLKALGNGWTVDIISYLLQGVK